MITKKEIKRFCLNCKHFKFSDTNWGDQVPVCTLALNQDEDTPYNMNFAGFDYPKNCPFELEFILARGKK